MKQTAVWQFQTLCKVPGSLGGDARQRLLKFGGGWQAPLPASWLTGGTSKQYSNNKRAPLG